MQNESSIAPYEVLNSPSLQAVGSVTPLPHQKPCGQTLWFAGTSSQSPALKTPPSGQVAPSSEVYEQVPAALS